MIQHGDLVCMNGVEGQSINGQLFFNFWGQDLPSLAARAINAKNKTKDHKRILLQEYNSSFLVEKLIPAFDGIDSETGDVDVEHVEEAMLLEDLLDDYISRLSHVDGNSFTDFCAAGQSWVSEAMICLDRACDRSSKSKDDKSKYNASKLEVLLRNYICCAFTQRVITNEQNPYAAYFDTVPFNCWGDNLSESVQKAKSRIVHRDEDSKFFDYVNNCHFFYEWFSKEYNNTLTTLSYSEFGSHEKFEELFYSLSEDYYCRLTKEHDITSDELAFAAMFWIWELRTIVEGKLRNVSVYLNTEGRSFLSGGEESVKWYYTLYEFYQEQSERLGKALARIQDDINARVDTMRMGLSSQTRSGEDTNDHQPPRTISGKRDEASNRIKFKPEPKESNINGLVFTGALPREKHQILYNIIREAVETKDYYVGFAYIKVAINLRYLRNPKFPEVERAFKRYKGKERNYSNFMGKNGKYSEENLSHEHKELLGGIEEIYKNQLG